MVVLSVCTTTRRPATATAAISFFYHFWNPGCAKVARNLPTTPTTPVCVVCFMAHVLRFTSGSRLFPSWLDLLSTTSDSSIIPISFHHQHLPFCLTALYVITSTPPLSPSSSILPSRRVIASGCNRLCLAEVVVCALRPRPVSSPNARTRAALSTMSLSPRTPTSESALLLLPKSTEQCTATSLCRTFHLPPQRN